jgi:propionyl-CoA carboxylase alpha chain
VADGSVVGVHYDPLLAKVVAHAPTREEAARMLAAALSGARLHGIVTNRDLLVGVLRSASFLSGATDTAFLDRHPPAELTAAGGSLGGRGGVVGPAEPSAVRLHAAAAALAAQAERRAIATVYPTIPSGWRNNPSQLQRVELEATTGVHVVGYRFDRAGDLEALEVDGEPLTGARLWGCGPDLVDLEVGGVRRRFEVHRVGDVHYLDGPLGHAELRECPRFPDQTAAAAAGGSLASPLPGIVRRVAVRPGELVAAGALLVVVEAMKLEHRIGAPTAGRVRDVLVAEGQEVDAGAPVAVLEEADDA